MWERPTPKIDDNEKSVEKNDHEKKNTPQIKGTAKKSEHKNVSLHLHEIVCQR